MRIWRKNRTQFAELFCIDKKYVLGFLVGESYGRNITPTKTIELLNGKIISMTIASSINKVLLVEEEEFVETMINGEGCLIRQRIYKSGIIKNFIISIGH